MTENHTAAPEPALRDVPVDWEALEDAFENNAPEVHSYLHLATGEVLRVVDGVADPQMHVRISSDATYLRVDPVSSREQYRWMERFIPMVEEPDLRGKLTHSIDGKGAFRRFKDVLMSFAAERERWFTFRSERLRTFMEAWLTAHAIHATPRPPWVDGASELGGPTSESDMTPESGASASATEEVPRSQSGRRTRNAEASRLHLKEIAEGLGARELDSLTAFAEFLKARRVARGFVHHHDHQIAERESTGDLARQGRSGGETGSGG